MEGLQGQAITRQPIRAQDAGTPPLTPIPPMKPIPDWFGVCRARRANRRSFVNSAADVTDEVLTA